MQDIVLPTKGMKGATREQALREFANQLVELSNQIGFRVSARGWCYQLESLNLINKSQFDVVENLVNTCRSCGYLPIDFTAEEEGRKFSGVEIPTDESPIKYMRRYVDAVMHVEDYYTPNWWRDENYYIQMLVEKIDLKTLFSPVCEQYHIPIATAKGWSSMLQRAEYARRFAEAEEQGLKCVLLYMGDFDPDGLRISDFIRSNLADLSNIRWDDGVAGYDPSDLIIERFGLSHETIAKHNLTWIDNLMTGSGGCIARVAGNTIIQGTTANGRPHPNFNMPYAQDYLKQFGVRKCESNALVPMPQIARKIARTAIEKYLGLQSKDRFDNIHQEIVNELTEFRQRTGVDVTMEQTLKIIDDDKGE